MQIRTHALLAVLLLAACGGDGGGGGGTSDIVEVMKWTPSGDNQSAIAGTTLPLVLRVKVTVNDQVSAGHTVTWSGPGSFGTPSMVTGSNGIATTTWTLPQGTGTLFANATVVGAVGSPVSFTANSRADVPAVLVKVSGDNQNAEINQMFGAPFQVQVADQYGNGVDSVVVAWSVNGPVELIADSVITTGGGYANGFMKAQGTIGPVSITATVTGLTGSPRTFNADVVSTPVIVEVKNNFFDPSIRTISVGQAVKWVWVGSGHTVSSTSGPPIGDTPIQNAGATYGPIVFDTPGTYNYECGVHPSMAGTVIVNP